MFPTVEVRWFFRDAVFRQWRLSDEFSASTSRSDWYACPCDPRSGIKVREGRLETKLRTGRIPHAFPRAAGAVESWQKWSVELPADDVPSANVLQVAGWVEVCKQRDLQWWSCDERRVYQVGADEPHNVQCELTRLTVGNQLWWTIGFETAGHGAPSEQRLQQVVAQVLDPRIPVIALTAENSCGFPEWLRTCLKERWDARAAH